MMKKITIAMLALLMFVSGSQNLRAANPEEKIVFQEKFVSEPTDPSAVGFYEFINSEEGDERTIDSGEDALFVFNDGGTLDADVWERRVIKFRNLPLYEGKMYRLDFKLKGSTRYDDGVHDADARPYCKASAQLLQGEEGFEIPLLDTKGKEQRGEFKEFSEDEYVSYSVTFAFASKQQQIDAFAALNLGELADKYSLALSIYNPGMFYLKDVVISEVGDIPPPATYQVRMSAGTTDAESWTISPTEATTTGVLEETPVTLTYNGRLKVKSVTARIYTLRETPLTIEALTAGNIVVTNPQVGMKFSLNGADKEQVTDAPIPLAAGQTVAFYGSGITSYNGTNITGDGTDFTCKVYGNIMSLLNETDFAGLNDLTNLTNVFCGLFKGNTALTDASDLLLPATTLASNCYQELFYGCTNLTTAPALPATTLEEGCYSGMFSGCKSLTTSPVLPAQELVELCYNTMFLGCTNLNTVTCLATSGFSSMNPTGLWLQKVAATGTFYKAEGATWTLDNSSGIPSGWTPVDYVTP